MSHYRFGIAVDCAHDVALNPKLLKDVIKEIFHQVKKEDLEWGDFELRILKHYKKARCADYLPLCITESDPATEHLQAADRKRDIIKDIHIHGWKYTDEMMT